MHCQPLTRREILELHESPDEFIAAHPERILIHMRPDPEKSRDGGKVYVADKIVVVIR